jgi:hypothetical protein
MKIRHGSAAPAIALLTLAGCATQPKPTTIADTTAARPDLIDAESPDRRRRLTDTLKGSGPYTMFAPTDDAFKALPPATLQKLAATRDAKSVRATTCCRQARRRDVKSHCQADVVTAPRASVHEVDRVLLPPAASRRRLRASGAQRVRSARRRRWPGPRRVPRPSRAPAARCPTAGSAPALVAQLAQHLRLPSASCVFAFQSCPGAAAR